MTELSIDVQDTWALLIGTGVFDDENLPAIPAVENNLLKFRKLLTDREIMGIPDNQIIVIENQTRDNIEREIKEKFLNKSNSKLIDTLIVYYVGHGVLKGAELRFTATNTTFDFKNFLWDSIYQKANNLFYILDCCYSGKLLRDSDCTTEALKVVKKEQSKKISILTASLPNISAKAFKYESYTTFSGHFFKALENGCGHEPALTPLQIFQELKTQLEKQGYPEPWHHDYHSEPLYFAKNHAHQSDEYKIQKTIGRLKILKKVEEYVYKDVLITYQKKELDDLFNSLER